MSTSDQGGGRAPGGASIEALAEALVSGRPIDWHSARRRADDPRRIDNLRTIQSIMALFDRVDPAEGGSRAGAVDGFAWGHLRVMDKLGEGSFGEVFRAYDTILEREVALKLRRHRGGDAGDHDRSGAGYIAEARRLARVRHPNVLAVHGADVHDGRVGLWSDLLDGSTLEALLAESGPLPAARVLAIAGDLARALEAVHDRGIVHGDVKAANVMCEPGGTAVLMDFGAGLDLNQPGANGGLSGTPLAMAPERLQGNPPTATSDLYSLGVLLYRLLAGRYPVQAGSLGDLVAAHDAVGGVPDLPRGVSRALRALVLDLLAANPSRRPSAADTVARIESIRTAPGRRRRRFAVAGVVVSLGIGTVVATFGLVQARLAEHRAETVNDFLREMLAAPRLVEGGLDVPVREVLDQAHARIERDDAMPLALRAEMLRILGGAYWSLNQNAAAVAVLEEAVALADRTFAASAPEHVGARLALAEAYLDAGSVDAARAALAAVEVDMAGLAAGDAQRLYGHRLAARLAHRDGDTALALAETEAAVALRRTPAERDDWPFRLAQSAHARALIGVGRFDRAEAELRDLLAWFEHRYGPRNTNALSGRFLLAEVLDRQGRSAEAIPMLRRTLEETGRWLGEDAFRHGQTLAVLSSALTNAGELEEALAMNRAAADVLARATPGNENAIASVANNRGLILSELGRYAEAEAAYREALAAVEGLAMKTPTELVLRFNLAEVLLLDGRPAEALAAATAARSAMVARVGEDHLFVLVTDGVIGAAETRLGRLDAGAARLEAAVARARRQLGDDNPSTLDNAYYLAHNEWARGARASAVERLRAVVAGRRAVLGEAHAKTLAAAADLAAWTVP